MSYLKLSINKLKSPLVSSKPDKNFLKMIKLVIKTKSSSNYLQTFVVLIPSNPTTKKCDHKVSQVVKCLVTKKKIFSQSSSSRAHTFDIPDLTTERMQTISH